MRGCITRYDRRLIATLAAATLLSAALPAYARTRSSNAPAVVFVRQTDAKGRFLRHYVKRHKAWQYWTVKNIGPTTITDVHVNVIVGPRSQQRTLRNVQDIGAHGRKTFWVKCQWQTSSYRCAIRAAMKPGEVQIIKTSFKPTNGKFKLQLIAGATSQS